MNFLKLPIFCALLFCFCARAEVLPPRPATQAEVTAGTDGVHPVTPKTLAGAGLSGPTNGITQGQFKGGLESGTNTPVFNGITVNGLGAMTQTNGGSSPPLAFVSNPFYSGTLGAVLMQLTSYTNGTLANSGFLANYFVGAFIGNAALATNLINGPTVSAGTNILVTRTQNANGSTNTAVALADPVALNAASVNTLTVSNMNGNANGLTNMPFTSLSFVTLSNAFTNTIVGYLRFTNSGDGRVFTIAVGTNMP